MHKLLLTALLTTVAIPALAADLPAKAPRQQPLAAHYNWSGFYVGGHLGAGWARNKWSDPENDCAFPQDVGCPPAGLGSHNAIGPLGGIQAGFNWQVQPWLVLGVEGEFSFARLKGDHQDSFSQAVGFTVERADESLAAVLINSTEHVRMFTHVKDIATVAGRIGFVNDRTMWFVKGGAAWAKSDFRAQSSAALLICAVAAPDAACADANFASDLSISKRRTGYVLGTGLEFALWGNWTAKVEYDYLDLGKKTATLKGTACAASFGTGDSECFDAEREFKIDQTLHVVKVGLNYRFLPFGGQ